MDNDFSALRSALIGDELKHLQLLHEEYTDKIAFTNRVSENLAVAIVQSSADSDMLVNALKLPVMGSMALAVDSHREQVTQMLAPVIMPVIGQAVAKVARESKESIESLVNSLFTVQGIQWRLEARRSGKSYSEVVFKNKHHFMIEQIVLSAKRNGAVLSQALKQGYADSHDTKIRDEIDQHIIQASQKVTITADHQALDHQALTSTHSYTVHGVWSSLTAIITGDVNEAFLLGLRKQLKSIEMDSNAALKAYRTDAAPFLPLAKTLTRLLDFVPAKAVVTNQAEKKGFPVTKCLLGALLLAGLAWLAFMLFNRHEKNAITQALSAPHGFVMLNVGGDALAGWTVQGMHDPHLFNLKKTGLSESLLAKLQLNTVPFISLSKASILARLQKRLAAPAGIEYSIDDAAPNTLIVKGNADEAWLAKLNATAPLVEGIDTIDSKGVVKKVDYAAIFAATKQRLESQVLLFQNKLAQLDTSQMLTIEQMAGQMKGMNEWADKNNVKLSFLVATHISGNSGRSDNTKLLLDRFTTVQQLFADQQINPAQLVYEEWVDKPLNKPAATISVVQTPR